ncbi:hypothetical protein F5877DRAFT_46837, partial [Lentinula edodes]
YDYSIVSAIDATLEPLLEGENLRWPLETYERIGGMPWFAEYLTCAQHFYNWTAQDGTSFLRGTQTFEVCVWKANSRHCTGNITLHPPYAGPGVFNPVTYPVQGINGVFEFKIVGPLICEEFV